MSLSLKEKIYERLDFYSDRFKDEGLCGHHGGAKPTDTDHLCNSRNRHLTDKNLYHTYAPYYADLIDSLVKDESDFALLELGISRGGSVAAWCESMPKAFICGVDKDLSLMWFNSTNYSNLKVIAGNHGDLNTYSAIEERKFDIIIDDGSHQSHEQVQNFSLLKNFLKPGGVYVIEDVYPQNTYPDDFLGQFQLVDLSIKSGRFDDRILVYR
jgi:hypothetical protein